MHLHPEVPLPVFLGLMHFRVALLGHVLGRAGRADDGRVDDGALLEQPLLLLQQAAHLSKDLLGQLVFLEQRAKARPLAFHASEAKVVCFIVLPPCHPWVSL